MLIGLTGQIGAGKSTVAEILATLGAVIVDADLIGRQVVESSGELYGQLIEAFGAEIVSSEGSLDRKKLAKIAFQSDQLKAKLNELVHPHLLSELHAKVKELDPSNNLVVIDAALLIDWGLDTFVDEVWVVEADESNRISRLVARGFTKEDALARQKAQPTAEEFHQKATRLINNNYSHDELILVVSQLIKPIIE